MMKITDEESNYHTAQTVPYTYFSYGFSLSPSQNRGKESGNFNPLFWKRAMGN